MNTDAHGSDMSLTEGVMGSAFEVANVLGSGFLRAHFWAADERR
jgi:hypothetical protein